MCDFACATFGDARTRVLHMNKKLNRKLLTIPEEFPTMEEESVAQTLHARLGREKQTYSTDLNGGYQE